MQIFLHNGVVIHTTGRGIPMSFNTLEWCAAELALDFAGTAYAELADYL